MIALLIQKPYHMASFNSRICEMLKKLYQWDKISLDQSIGCYPWVVGRGGLGVRYKGGGGIGGAKCLRESPVGEH